MISYPTSSHARTCKSQSSRTRARVFCSRRNCGIPIICIYMHIIAFSYPHGGTQKCKTTHYYTSNNVHSSISASPRTHFRTKSGCHFPFHASASFAISRNLRNSIIYIYIRIIEISLRTGGRKMARMHTFSPLKVRPLTNGELSRA